MRRTSCGFSLRDLSVSIGCISASDSVSPKFDVSTTGFGQASSRSFKRFVQGRGLVIAKSLRYRAPLPTPAGHAPPVEPAPRGVSSNLHDSPVRKIWGDHVHPKFSLSSATFRGLPGSWRQSTMSMLLCYIGCGVSIN